MISLLKIIRVIKSIKLDMDSKCLKECFHLKLCDSPSTNCFYLLAFAYQGKGYCVQIHYKIDSSLGDFGPLVLIGLFLYEDF